MQLLLAILLYLKIICSPGVYTTKQIKLFQDHNRCKIDAVKNDNVQMEIVNNQYAPQADRIIIIQSEDD